MEAHKYSCFGPAVRRMRMTKGVSQKALALQLGVSTTWLCSIERGRTVGVSAPFASELGRTLGLDAAQLADLEWAAERDRIMREVVRTTDTAVSDVIHDVLASITLLERQRWPSLGRLAKRLALQIKEADALLPIEEDAMP